MKIYIPTRGRPDRQRTAVTLSAAGIPFTLVCSDNDPRLGEYAELGYPMLRCKARNIHEKRQFIIDHHKHGKLVMMDDDLRFYTRRQDGGFDAATSGGMTRILKRLEKALDSHAHAGLCDKFMSHNRPRGHGTHGRYNQVLAYNLDAWPHRHRPTFRLAINEEHDMHLQLATRGLAPWIDYEMSKDAPYYAAGGCSVWRTPEVEADAMRAFQMLWPHLVTVVDSPSSISGKAIRVKWKEAIRANP